MPVCLASDRLALLISLLVCAAALAALVVAYPLAAPIPCVAVGTVLFARRTDVKGGLLYLTLLSLLAVMAYAICLGGSLLLDFLGGRVPILVATLVVVKELQRFLDNEYGQGWRGRRVGIAVLAVLLGAAQVLLVWKA